MSPARLRGRPQGAVLRASRRPPDIRGGGDPGAAEGETLSAALITVPANELMREIHNEKLRMPAVLLEEHHAAWLRGTAEEARAALVEYPSADMVAWQVSRRLYANKTPDDESLIERASRD